MLLTACLGVGTHQLASNFPVNVKPGGMPPMVVQHVATGWHWRASKAPVSTKEMVPRLCSEAV